MKKVNCTYYSMILVGMFFFISSCNNQGSGCAELQAEADNLKNKIDSVAGRIATLEAIDRKQKSNKKLVTDLYQELFGDKNLQAIDKYIGDTYIQHNPNMADGPEALKVALRDKFERAPKERVDIQHIGADGDLVFIHTRLKMGNTTASAIDIFRVEGNKVVEHWDVIQEVPKNPVSKHPMF